ncbi:protein Hook homolog 3 [Daphnia magna]|uniref:Protein hook n=1 Tax=Daphnia magna TaxID=35525 RepID=A0ABQ9YW78_9CRUS|nr:protein Hook homolog 3 [Daphnia magna]KAK4004896.1 hypothetical protein OUZ56_006624 [Daphnia magna]
MAAQWQLHHLLQWLHQFNLDSPQPNAASLSDGVTVAKVLNLIDPPWFNVTWLSKIKENVASNKILKVSNWKKVLERLVDYYEVHLGQRLSGFTMPDVSKIGESEDETELCRLLQLVLGCAVHCERQEEFIQAILQMEEDVQRGIMAAIQGLPGIDELAGGSLVPNADSLAVMAGRSPSQTTGMGFQNLMAQLEAANEERKLLAKERQKLNLQISTLQDEIQHLQAEVESLRSGGVPLESLDRSDGSNPSALMQKREIVRLTEELLRSDSAREEVRLRCEALEQELARLRMRQDDLQSAAEQTRSLKDEVDILRERSARLENAQSTIDSMRRKVEEGNELKRQLRKLEEKNSQYIQQNMELEEELKKLGPWKSQLELQKKQIAEVQAALDDERRRADKFELQFKNVVERNEALTLEKERLVTERDKLIELNEEFKFAQLNNGAMMPQEGSPSTTGVDTLDMIPPEIREKLLRLQHENRLLKEKKDGGQDEAEVLQTVNAGLLERIGRLEAENRKSTKRVLELEIQLENNRVASPVSSSGAESQSDTKDVAALKIRIKSLEREVQQKKLEVEKMEHRLTEQMERTKGAQETLNRKENEMQAMEERYKRYIEKAKMVLKTLDPKNNPSAASPEMAALQAQLREKDRLIERLEIETERHKALRETEDQLVTTAFYNLGMQLQRQAMEQRLGSSNAVQNQAMAPVPAPSTAGQGFLTRSRQAAVRGRTSSINQHGETFN